jgi:hypothetical protein
MEAVGDFSVGIAGTHGPSPVLAEACHIQIVPGHRGVDMHDTVAQCAQTAAELRFLAGNEAWIVSFDLGENGPPHQNISTAKIRVSGRIDPVKIKNAVVDGTLRVEFPAMPPYGGNAGVGFKGVAGSQYELRVEDRIAVKKENVRRGCPLPPCIAGSRRGLKSSLKNDNLGIKIGGYLRTAVG